MTTERREYNRLPRSSPNTSLPLLLLTILSRKVNQMHDAVTEINIENPAAKEAFIRWWRTMEAQGYQYGFEALCNVWVGFDDGRADLARKVLAAVERAADDYCNCGAIRRVSSHRASCRSISADLAEKRIAELFQKEGIHVTTTKGDR